MLVKLNQKQNYLLLAAFALGFVACFLASYFRDANKVIVDISDNSKKNDRVVAMVEKSPIYLGDVENVLRKINSNVNFNNLDDKTKEIVVKEVAAQKALLHNALKSGAGKKLQNDEVKDFLAYQVQQEYLDEISRKNVSDKKIKETYDQLAKNLQGKKEYKLQHILLVSKSDADKAEAALDAGKSFEEVAKQFSADKQSAANGGNLGYVVEGTLIAKFDEEMKKIAINQTSRPFKTDLGWHIIKVEDKRDATPAKFEDAKERIRDSLAGEEKKSYVKNLVEKSKIELVDSEKK